MIDLLFFGAAGEVTGSMHLVHWSDRWIALDCGLFQGRRADSESKNRTWPVPPSAIDAVILSHAHIDHSGRLPRLVRDGFDGPIYCTPATRDLCAIMLPDSAYVQAEDVSYVNKRRKRENQPPIEALYDQDDVLATIPLMQTIAYGRPFRLFDGVQAVFQEAGHMLGSAGVRLDFDSGGTARSLYFTGDVGRPRRPILRDPAPFPQVDALICESTYGGRINEDVEEARGEFLSIVRHTIDRGGKVIIPAFSVGRTQTIAYFLHRLMDAGDLPHIPVYVDSPLAVNASEVFRMHPDCYDAEARAFLEKTGDIIGARCCTYIRDVEESKALHGRPGPFVIISASGMCEGGRIRHHLKNNIRDGRNTILFPGYQAENTLGRRLVDGARRIRLFDDELPVNAEVVQINGFSGHADQAELLDKLEPLKRRTRIFLVHGEQAQREALTGKLHERGFQHVGQPMPGERVKLGR
jgi:metallo-beta-lactamase family protein